MLVEENIPSGEDTYALTIQMIVDLLNGLIVGNNFLPVLLGHDVFDEVD